MDNTVPLLRVRPKSLVYHYDLVGEIGEAIEHTELVDALREATGEDVVHIHINTPGGNLSTVAQILHNIALCEGTVITEAEGQVASGGSLIFFSGHQLIVGPFSEFLAHSPAGGQFGKVYDQLDGGKHLEAYAKGLYETAYTPFYTKKEINAILRGKELYETAPQVEARLKRVEEQLAKD